MRNSTLNKIWCRCFTNGMRCRIWGTVLMGLLADPSVSAWLTWGWHGQNLVFISEIIQSLCHNVTITFPTTEPPCKTQRPCPVVPAHYSATPIASLAGSHNKSDARDTGTDVQQLVEFVVDDALTVVQLLTQVFLPHLYLLSPLILTYI